MGSLLNAFRVPELRKRLAFTAFILALYRLARTCRRRASTRAR